jgi:hypothetical protein
MLLNSNQNDGKAYYRQKAEEEYGIGKVTTEDILSIQRQDFKNTIKENTPIYKYLDKIFSKIYDAI